MPRRRTLRTVANFSCVALILGCSGADYGGSVQPGGPGPAAGPPSHAPARPPQVAEQAWIGQLDREASGLLVDAAFLRQEADAATQDYKTAILLYGEAQRLGAAASDKFKRATADWTEAETRFRWVSLLVIAAAASDLLGHGLCGSVESTAKFRRDLRGHGIDLDGKDVDHVFPRAFGGADHPLNYQLLPSSLNRALGDDVVTKFMMFPGPFIQGLVISALVALGCR